MKVPPKSGEDKQVKHADVRSGREQRRPILVNPGERVAHFIPVEEFFTTKKVKESRFKAIDFPSVPPGAGHGVGTSPSASTLQKPHRKKKFLKIKAKPTGK